jgi:hypothetical protein
LVACIALLNRYTGVMHAAEACAGKCHPSCRCLLCCASPYQLCLTAHTPLDPLRICALCCPAGPLGTVQMMLNQLGLQSGSALGSNSYIERRMRWMNGDMDPADPSAAAGTGRPSADSHSVRAIANVMQTLTAQLLPAQHRLLALPPRVAASESAALLEAANLQPQQQPADAAAAGADAAPGAAAGGAAGVADSSLRSQASTVSTLSRLVSRMNETAAPNSSSYLRDGRISVRHPGTGGLINVSINPALLSPNLGPGSSLWQTLEALGQPGGLLAGGPGGGGLPALADLNDSVWDEAVNQLLEVLAPNGVGRRAPMPTGGLAPPGAAGRATAAGAADNAGLDPREFLSTCLLQQSRVCCTCLYTDCLHLCHVQAEHEQDSKSPGLCGDGV